MKFCLTDKDLHSHKSFVNLLLRRYLNPKLLIEVF